MEGEGGTIQDSIQRWLVESKDKSEAEAQALVGSFSPPNLVGEGAKVQDRVVVPLFTPSGDHSPVAKCSHANVLALTTASETH